MSSSASADRNLLFGVLAMQMNFIGRDALVAAMNAWVVDKHKPLGQILAEHGQLTAAQLHALDGLIDLQLQANHNDPRQSLQAMPATATARQCLAVVTDGDVQDSLMSLATIADEDSATPAPVSNGAACRYRILRRHAKGGLGEVFVAEDCELHREVALKEIQAHRADDAASRARFLLEAEITGGLEHPGIVPVYGFGKYPDGRPYYAMRFIRGDSLKKAIDQFHETDKPGRDPGERSLALRHLLRRFIDACNAVAYAHSRGVLHRDLKPPNIMLGHFGETLVVDWGLAKAGFTARNGEASDIEVTSDPSLHPSGSSDGPITLTGAALGTPNFMSPEQAAGRIEEMGPPSDVYSLGATLYFLLTGRKPFDGTSSDEVLAQVKRGEFAPPSQVKAQTPRPLDAICRKAMAMQARDRYPTALDLAADIEHWLADEPVVAYPEPTLARMGRWTRRNRTAVVGTTVFLACVVLALSVGLAMIWTEKQRTAQQKQAALENYALARDASFTGIDLIATAETEFAADPAKHRARKRFLSLASQTMDQLRARQPNDVELQIHAAQAYRFTANIHRLSYEMIPAEKRYADSIRLYQGLAEQHPEDRQHHDNLVETMRDHASALSFAGKLKAAQETLVRALEMDAEPAATDGAHIQWQRRQARALLSLAALEHSRGMLEESKVHAGKSAELFRKLIKLPEDARHVYDPVLAAAAVNILAIVEREANRVEAALPLHTESIRLIQEMLDQSPAGVVRNDLIQFGTRFQFEHSKTLSADPGQRAKAEELLAAVIHEWDILVRNFHLLIPMYSESLAMAYHLRGQIRLDSNRRDEARADFEQAQILQEDLVKQFSYMPGMRADLGRTYIHLAKLETEKANVDTWHDKARKLLEEASKLAPDSAEIQRALKQLPSHAP
jgi:serine/threonine-protein kinase